MHRGVRRVEQADGVAGRLLARALAHLLLGGVQAHDARAGGRDHRVRQLERGAVELVEARGDVPRELDVLLLVGADGHLVCLVEEDVGRHQRRVGQQARADGVRRLGLGLELGHAVEPAEGAGAGEHPGELGVRGDLGLDEHGGALRVDAAGEVERGDLERLLAQHGGLDVLRHGERVEIDDAEEVLVGVLEVLPLEQGAQVVADVQRAAGLDAREHARLPMVRLAQNASEDRRVYHARRGAWR